VGSEQALPPISRLNELDAKGFAASVAPLFEGAPRFVARLAAARPFADDAEMLQRARGIARAMPEEEQIELIEGHPRIGADPASVSPLSREEQGYDLELDSAAAELARTYEELAMLNELYERRFGFRFVVFVAGRPKREMIPLMERALTADRDAELRRALDDTIAIAADRLKKLRPAFEVDEHVREVIAANVSRWMVGATDRDGLILAARQLVEQGIESEALLDLSLADSQGVVDIEPAVKRLLNEIGLSEWTLEQAGELVALHHAAAIVADELPPSEGARQIVEHAAPLWPGDERPEWLMTFTRLAESWEKDPDDRPALEAEITMTAGRFLGHDGRSAHEA
jgi:2-oxo-4-hydroxy-4-carboxy--5-ureidoimidazoline (OHCU) decarboxylase